MSEQNDGGPAFPKAGLDPWAKAVEVSPGMSLRDYFAAKAMCGILGGDHPITHDPDPLPTIAKVAYDLADAMLKARSA